MNNNNYKKLIYSTVLNGEFINCVVSEWSEWSVCDANTTTRTRTRTIIIPASNGGTACPVLTETEDCPTISENCFKLVSGRWSKGFRPQSPNNVVIYYKDCFGEEDQIGSSFPHGQTVMVNKCVDVESILHIDDNQITKSEVLNAIATNNGVVKRTAVYYIDGLPSPDGSLALTFALCED